ncbi:hypothetical protein ACOYR1_15415 [Thalassotalea piscium]
MTRILRIQLISLLLAIISLLNSQSALAQASINDMQTCQGLIDFLKIRLKESNDTYSTTDINTVIKGLDTYNNYIQDTIVSPGLITFYQGDKNKAIAAQQKVDLYKQSIVQKYQQRFPQKQLYMDFAVSLNNCTQKTVPAGQDLADLKTSFTKLLELLKHK